MKVSVVIPTRNRPELVSRAVESVLQQSFTDFEVLVVVDGPDPDTVTRLQEFRDVRVRVIALPESVGGSEARNVGAMRGTGEWIALLDDDDEWMPEKLERQVRAAQVTGSNRVLAVSQYLQRAPGQEDVLWPRRLPKPDEPMAEFMFDYLCYFQTSTFLCSRELFLTIPFRKGQRGFQDIEWFLRVSSDPTVTVVVVPEALSIYYAPVGRATITSGLSWRDRLKWGQEHKGMLTRRAYSRFIVGSCAGSAVQQRGGLKAFARLMYECAVVGSPSPRLLAILCTTFLLTPESRRYIRDRFLLRRVPLKSEA